MANNKIYKNSVFVDLFSVDQTAPANFLSLYNALHGTHLTLAETTVDIRVLERTLYMGFKNDVSAIIDGKLIVLIEHQSTINENMPLRFLEYVAEFYKQLIPLRKRYYKSLVKIPRPEFYMLYNARKNYWRGIHVAQRAHGGALSVARIALIFVLPYDNSRHIKNDMDVIFDAFLLKFL